MSIQDSKLALPGKQTDVGPDTSLHFHIPSELPCPDSKQLSRASADVRFGSEAEVASDPGLAAVRTSDVVSLDRNRRSSEPARARSS